MRLIYWSLVELLILVIAAVLRAHWWTYGADTGTFMQVIIDTPHGMRNGVEAGSHFHYHWSPSLALLWPLIALTRSNVVLQIVQAVAIVATAPLLYALLCPYAGERIAYRLGIVALIYPPLLALGFDEFHELGLFPPIAVALVLAADRAKWWWYALASAVAIGLREDVALETIAIGGVLAVIGLRARANGRGLFEGAPREPRALVVAGACTALAGVFALLAYRTIVLTRFGGWGPQHFYVYDFANGPMAVVAASVLHPFAFARELFTLPRLTYVLEAIVPLVFLPLRTRWALLAIPGACVVLLANSGYVWRMGDHYAALWIPWLLIAAGFGLAHIERRNGERIALRWSTASAIACVVFLIAFDPMHPLHYFVPNYHDLASARRALDCVPRDASLSTHDEWFSTIAASYPLATVERGDGVAYLVYADDMRDSRFQQQIRPALASAVAHHKYVAVCRFGEVTAYRRAP